MGDSLGRIGQIGDIYERLGKYGCHEHVLLNVQPILEVGINSRCPVATNENFRACVYVGVGSFN
jgi:hypothetical protein